MQTTTNDHTGNELPTALQNRIIDKGDYIVGPEWYDMDEPDAHELRRALRDLSIETETDADGLYVTQLPTICPHCGKVNPLADEDGYTDEAPREYHAACWVAHSEA